MPMVALIASIGDVLMIVLVVLGVGVREGNGSPALATGSAPRTRRRPSTPDSKRRRRRPPSYDLDGKRPSKAAGIASSWGKDLLTQVPSLESRPGVGDGPLHAE